MTYSEIKITFNQKMPIDGRVTFVIQGSSSTFGIIAYERWVLFRSGSNQVSRGTFTGILAERSAINFLASFNLDYNSTGIYVTERIGTQVIIKATDPNISFSFGQATLPGVLGQPSTLLNVDFEYNNFDSNALFRITDVTFSQATNPCTHVRVSVDTSELATTIVSPISVDGNTDNPFSFEFLRGIGTQIKCSSADGQEAIRLINLPAILSSGNLNITINNSPSGATVVANLSVSFGLNLQYSLDNSTWQTSNTFNGLGADDYTLYVKDQYGCSISKSFSVDDFGIQTAYFLISKANSLRFAKRIDWGNCSNYKNDENTLSCEVDVPLPKTEIQRFQSCDIITTQFRSNYDDISAFVIKENGDEDELIIEQKTNNMRLNDMRDARIYNLGGGKTGIYFLSGNIYNYTTGIDTGENYALNGALPEWAIVDNYIRLLGSWLVIEDIIYDESRNAEVIVVTNNFFGSDTISQVASVFNRFNYEVYEFSVNMANYLNQNIRVKINNSDNSFTDLIHLTELINVKEKQKDTVEIIYKNDTNTDIFYSTGIEHKLRLLINSVNGKVEDNSETYKTDTTSLLLSAEIYELDEFLFEPLTKELMRKLLQALSHKTVFINGIGYVKNDAPEVEGALEESNLYIVKATMIKTNTVYNSNGTTIDTIGLPSEVLDVPSLIGGDETNRFIEG